MFKTIDSIPQHSIDYRKEVTKPLISRINASESCVLVSASSMGKTRFLDYFMRPDIQEHYFQEHIDKLLILRVDCNRLFSMSEFGLYELMLTAVVEGCLDYETKLKVKRYPQFNDFRHKVVRQESTLLALRNLELALRVMVRHEEKQICFLFDEFDEAYSELPARALANLRAIRDANKNWLSYVLVMRHFPDTLRTTKDDESFYELVSHFFVGLPTYSVQDAKEMLLFLENRRGTLDNSIKKAILFLAGGHPGTISALFRSAMEDPSLLLDDGKRNGLIDEPAITEEFEKLWGSLSEIEKVTYVDVLNGQPASSIQTDRLIMKGLLSPAGNMNEALPLFAHYIKNRM